jgi:hypothetical protein
MAPPQGDAHGEPHGLLHGAQWLAQRIVAGWQQVAAGAQGEQADAVWHGAHDWRKCA